MSSSRKPEGLAIVLTQVLVAVLTLVTLVPLFSVLNIPSFAGELAVALIVFAGWFLVISLVSALVQCRQLNPHSGRNQ